MQKKFEDVYVGICEFFFDIRCNFCNRLIQYCLRHTHVDSGTARMMIHKLSKGEIQYYLAEYDEWEDYYWRKNTSPFERKC